jgi:hypothetical protein
MDPRGLRRAFRSPELRGDFDKAIRAGLRAHVDGNGHVVLTSRSGGRVRLSSTAYSGPGIKRTQKKVRSLIAGVEPPRIERRPVGARSRRTDRCSRSQIGMGRKS